MVAENIHRDDVRYKPNTATWHHARMTDTTNQITLRMGMKVVALFR